MLPLAKISCRWVGLAGLMPLAFAAAPARADDAQLWLSARVNVKVAPRVTLSNEIVMRHSDQRGYYDFVDNFMIGYQLNRHVTVWAGYSRQTAMSHGNRTATEQRFRQQVSFDNIAHLGPLRFGGRLRMEERWRNVSPGTGWRLRPQEKVTMPLVGKLTLTVSHEDFINFNSTGFQSAEGEERMRNAISVSVPVSKHLAVDLGYLEQHGFVRNGPDTNDHVATVSLSAAF